MQLEADGRGRRSASAEGLHPHACQLQPHVSPTQAAATPHRELPPRTSQPTPPSPRLLARASQVRVKGGPEGKGAAKRVKVGYGSGDRLEVKVDGGVVRHACARVQPMCTRRA